MPDRHATFNFSTPPATSRTTAFARWPSPRLCLPGAISQPVSEHLCAVIPREVTAACFCNGRLVSDGALTYGSWGNGAPMRVAAVGWLARDEAEAMALAAAQAAVSHNHPDAIAAAQAVALANLLVRSGLPPVTLRQRLVEKFGYDLTPERALAKGGFDISAAATVAAALTAALEAADWEGAVRLAVCLGGDTDTLACIAGAVAEAVHGLPQGIADCARSHLTDDLRTVLEQFELAIRT